VVSGAYICWSVGYDLTLVEAEALEELAAKGVELSPAEARRNLDRKSVV
jgi:hypothetical protein